MTLAILAPVQWLIDVFLPVLEFFHDKIGFGWGTSIIVLTILLRFAVLPLSIKSFKSMLGLQAIAPQMKEMQKKYKDDKPRLQQETMKLYSENKVNPLGSCLPIIVQIPFLISFYYMLRTDLKDEICGVRSTTTSCSEVPNPLGNWKVGDPTNGLNLGGYGEHFLGIHDITAFATGGLLVLLLVLYVGSQMLSSVVNMPPTADKNQKRLMLGLPLFLVVFLIPIKPPSGVFLYWITTNLFTLVQQFSLRKIYGGPTVLEMAKDDSAGDGGLLGTKKPAPAAAAVASTGGGGSAPPPPPRKRKKKRSGRRR